MPSSFAITPNNTLLNADGIGPVLRWDGQWPVMEQAGVIPPATPCAISCTQSINRHDSISDASNTAPIVISTIHAHLLVDGNVVIVNGAGGNTAANGTWTVTAIDGTHFSLNGSIGNGPYTGGGTWNFAGPFSGSYQAYVRFVDRLGNVSNFSPGSNIITIVDGDKFTYTSVPTSDSSAVVRRQIFRNTADELLTFYLAIDTTDLSSATFTENIPDTILQNGAAQALYDSNGNFLADAYGPPPNWKPILAQHQTRMWLAGQVNFSEGACIVLFGSPFVTYIGNTVSNPWRESWPGRFFYGAGAQAPIEIQSVDVNNQFLTLVSPWTGPTDYYLNYVITPPPAEKNLLYFSAPGLPEAWVATNALQLPEDGFDVTGLMPMNSFLYIWKQQRLYRLTDQGDPINDGFIFLTANRGCVNNRCWVIIGDKCWSFDDFGIFQYSGGATEDISAPIQAIFRGTNRHYTLNWQASRFWHAIADVNSNTIRWFVTMSGDYLPYHALCYNFIAKKWWVEEYPAPIGCSCVGRVTVIPGSWRIQLQERLYLGGSSAGVFRIGGTPIIRLDLVDPAAGTTRGNVSTAGYTWFTCASAVYGDDVVGAPVAIVAGTGEGQTRMIASVAEGQVNITQPWTQWPDTTSVFQIGAVAWTWRTGRMTFSPSEERVTRKIQLGFRPVPAQQQAVAEIFDDYEEMLPTVQNQNYTFAQRRGASALKGDPRQRLDLTRKYGTVDINVDAQREGDTDAPRRLSILLYGWSRENALTLKMLAETGVSAQQSQQQE